MMFEFLTEKCYKLGNNTYPLPSLGGSDKTLAQRAIPISLDCLETRSRYELDTSLGRWLR